MQDFRYKFYVTLCRVCSLISATRSSVAATELLRKRDNFCNDAVARLHNVGPVKSLAGILEAETPMVVLEVVVVQVMHSGGVALWLEVLLQHEVSGCGHSAGAMVVHDGRTDASTGGHLLPRRLAVPVRRLFRFAVRRCAAATGRSRGFALLCLVLRFGLLLCLLAAFPLHSAILEPDLDLKARLHLSFKTFPVQT